MVYNSKKSKEIVAIDGPGGAGKSTLGKMLAHNLNFLYLDTGILYRSIGWAIHNKGINPRDKGSLIKTLPGIEIELEQLESRNQVRINGENVTSHLRSQLMGEYASIVSAVPQVREKLLSLQKKIGENGNVVMDGRDIGTVIFPMARYKFFIDASPEIRGERRYKELMSEGKENITLCQVVEQIRERDRADYTRKEAPLKRAHDAFYLDTSDFTLEEVFNEIINIIRRIRKEINEN